MLARARTAFSPQKNNSLLAPKRRACFATNENVKVAKREKTEKDRVHKEGIKLSKSVNENVDTADRKKSEKDKIKQLLMGIQASMSDCMFFNSLEN